MVSKKLPRSQTLYGQRKSRMRCKRRGRVNRPIRAALPPIFVGRPSNEGKSATVLATRLVTERACRRPPSPDSPQPYRETELREATFLPPVDPGTSPVLLDTLPAYIRDHNKSSKNKLRVIAPRKGRELVCPVILRFTCPNVVTIYLTLNYSTENDQTLVIENATAIGSREQVRACGVF